MTVERTDEQPLPLRELTRAECIELMSGQPIGRLAFAGDSGLVVIPVNFALRDSLVVLSTSPFGVIAREARGDVAFEVDQIDVDTRSGWSVLVQGRLEHDLADQLDHRPDGVSQPWASGIRTMRMTIEPRSITGRRLGPG